MVAWMRELIMGLENCVWAAAALFVVVLFASDVALFSRANSSRSIAFIALFYLASSSALNHFFVPYFEDSALRMLQESFALAASGFVALGLRAIMRVFIGREYRGFIT